MPRDVRLLVLVLFPIALLSVPIGCGKSSGRRGESELAPPGNVGASAGTSDVTVTWSAVVGATSYNLYWATSPGVTKATGNLLSGATSPYVHGGLTPGTTYHYVVTSLREAIEGTESVEVSATPTGLPPPTGVNATGGDAEVTIGWSAVPGATSCNLYWSNAPGVTRATGNLVSDVTSPFLHAGLTNGDAYHYVLTSLQGAGEGVESVEVSATPFIPGVLDPSFGGVGWTTHHNAGGGDRSDYGQAVALDAAGRILVAGSSASPTTDLDTVVWRYNGDGSLDTTFNGQGWVTHDCWGGGAWDDAWAITLDGSGKILVAGETDDVWGATDMVIWRFNDDGSLDASFNGQGWVTHDSAAGGSGFDWAYAIAIDPSGGILAAGASDNPALDLDMAVWRYDPTGSPDPTFGSGGVVVHGNAAGGDGDDEAYGITLDAAGRILVAGYSDATLDTDMVIWRYDSTGTLDTAFGTGGVVIHDGAAGGANNDWAEGIVVDSSGRVVVSGGSFNASGDNDMALWRYDTTGQLDPTFGTGGVVTHDDAAGGGFEDYGSKVALFSSALVVTGFSRNSSGDMDMVVWAFDTAGALIPHFASGGVLVHGNAAGGGMWDYGWALAVDSTGRIVVTGHSMNAATDQDMVIWRIR